MTQPAFSDADVDLVVAAYRDAGVTDVPPLREDESVAERVYSHFARIALSALASAGRFLPAGAMTTLPADDFDALVASLDEPDDAPNLRRAYLRALARRAVTPAEGASPEEPS